MAGTSTNEFASAPFYLDPNQQDLLLAALASNNQSANDLFSTGIDSKQTMNRSQFQYPQADNLEPAYFASPEDGTPSTTFNNINIDESPFVDYLDGDGSFDLDNADTSDLMIGALPGGNGPKGDGHDSSEKRKIPEDEADDPDGGGKRREPEDKTAKKPGRKPLTSEPTTKRKAQNRAAQRAFRERKEKHLKDLETKVAELEKASDAANHENGMLRAQVQRLQTELREYRKRLSLNSSAVNKTPALGGGFNSLFGSSGFAANNFQFEFPRFGGLPGSQMLDNGPLSKASKSTSTSSGNAAIRQNSTGRSLSPKSTNGSNAGSPDNGLTNGAVRSGNSNGRFNSVLGGSTTAPPLNTQAPPRRSTDSTTGSHRAFQFNSASSTNSDSPSASSNSHTGPNSSCDTSPEPSHNSPGNVMDTLTDGYVCHGNSEGEITFCEKLNMACGNPRNPVPRAMSKSDAKPSPTATKAPSTLLQGIDFFANQNGGQFDPTLFGDYRESQNAIVGDGDFTGGFFNDAFPITDFGSPFHFGDTPAVQKSNPLEEMERLHDGTADDEEVVPGEDPSSMLNCHKIWDKLSNRPDFKDGTIDIDNLCSELRAKARCSESGVVVDHKDVEAALQRLPKEANVGH